MKNFFSLIFCLGIFVSAFAQSETAEAVDGPVMEFENTTMDYGVIEKGADPLREFVFTNTGSEPLVIKHAKGSCGCTVPEWPKEPIMPGESQSIKVRYDTNRLGKFTKTVTLTTNEASEKRVLRIQGEVKNEVVEEAIPSNSGNILAPTNN